MFEQHINLDNGFSMTVLRCISVLGSFYLQNENTVYRLEILYYIVATIYYILRKIILSNFSKTSVDMFNIILVLDSSDPCTVQRRKQKSLG